MKNITVVSTQVKNDLEMVSNTSFSKIEILLFTDFCIVYLNELIITHQVYKTFLLQY